MEIKPIPKSVLETEELFKSYSRARSDWAMRAKEDRQFRLGEQWSEEDLEVLRARKQAPVVVNRIHPAVESAKAMLTANRPGFRVSPREDSDNQVAQAMNGLLQYIWQLSDGDTVMRQVIDDYYVTGLGCVYVYVDPTKDMGKGEVCMCDIDPLTVYIDPASRNRFADDAENIIISRLITRDQAVKMYPTLKHVINLAQGDSATDMPVTTLQTNGIVYPEDTVIISAEFRDKYVREYIRFRKEYQPHYRVFDRVTGAEDVLNKQEYAEYVKKPAWVIEGNVYTNQKMAEQAYQQAQQQYAMMAQQMAEQKAQQAQMMANQSGEPVPYSEQPPVEVEVQEITFKDLIDARQIDVVGVLQPVIKQWVIIGQEILYEGVLPIEHYPVVFFMNLYNRTPYPVSDVRMVRSLQEEINKTRSLIIAHAATSTSNKIILQRGAVDIDEFADRWASPSAVLEADLTDGNLQVVSPTPLSSELYNKETMAKSDIDHQMGLYEFMMGNAQSAPQTYKATISIDEFGQRRIKSKLQDIETGLKRLGEITIPLMQKLYTVEKVIRLIQPNNSLTEFAINRQLYDDYGNVVEVVNNITTGRYDVIVVSGSTLPTNRYAQLEFYMEAYKLGIIDRQEVLKKTEIFDQEGVLKRVDEIMQLQAALQQRDEQIKMLKGDLQTREREVMHAKQETELSGFKAKLQSVQNKADHSARLFAERASDAVQQIKQTGDTAKASAPKRKK